MEQYNSMDKECTCDSGRSGITLTDEIDFLDNCTEFVCTNCQEKIEEAFKIVAKAMVNGDAVTLTSWNTEKCSIVIKHELKINHGW